LGEYKQRGGKASDKIDRGGEGLKLGLDRARLAPGRERGRGKTELDPIKGCLEPQPGSWEEKEERPTDPRGGGI